MQTRLPARLGAPKLPSPARVISLEQSRGEEERTAGAGRRGTNLGLGLEKGGGVVGGYEMEIRSGLRGCCSVDYESVEC